jgi:cyclopropane-fatty-acyl-phospholipid synthase
MTATLGQASPDQAALATNGHYALPPEIFAAFLDKRLKYSCGLYSSPEATLDDAQENKLTWVAEQRLGLDSGKRLLDVGCGWGSLVLFAAQRYGCQVVGVTPSRAQRDYILARAAETEVAKLVDVRLGRFTAVDLGPQRFQAVAMLGSIVHMPDREDVLASVTRALTANGRVYISESCFRNAQIADQFATRPGSRYVGEEIFGFADMVPASKLLAAVEEAGLSLTALTDLTAHYPLTIEAWAERVRQNRSEIDLFALGMSDRLLRYFSVFVSAFGYTTKHYGITAEKSRMGTTEIV